jgi:beta-RFAP synthase
MSALPASAPGRVGPVAAPAEVEVAASARLHLGFLDPSGSLGRPFGSIGLVVEGFAAEVSLARAAADERRADGPAAAAELDRAAACVERLRERTGRRAPLALRLRRVLPAHAGFGSGTQLALAVGRAFAVLHGIEASALQLAAWLGRGRRSGIGIAGFDTGGLIVDGGPRADGTPALPLARIAFPAGWRVLLALDPARRGLSGGAERTALAALPVLPRSAAADLCHQVLMRVLPGAAAAEFEPFAAGVNRVQQVLAEHFAPAQGGSAWTSPAVGRLMQWIAATRGDCAAIGQSSWGPTGFAIVPSAEAAHLLADDARRAGVVDAALELRCVAGCNRGAAVAAARTS